MSKIAIGLPAFNEEKNIASIITQLKKKYTLIIVCDDGSSDLTSEIAKEMGAIVVRHNTNLGYGAAIRSLFLKANELNCDILVTFDSDGQHKISDIENVIKPIQNKEANIVIGSRFLGNVEGNLPTYRKLGIKAITNLVNSNTGNKITDSQSGFRGYDKITLQKVVPSIGHKGSGQGSKKLGLTPEFNFVEHTYCGNFYSKISNFYLTNCITRASRVMGQCSTAYGRRTNFIDMK